MKKTKQRVKTEVSIWKSIVTIRRVGVDSGHVYEKVKFDAQTLDPAEIDAQITGFLAEWEHPNITQLQFTSKVFEWKVYE